jgi:hypothetical protein
MKLIQLLGHSTGGVIAERVALLLLKAGLLSHWRGGSQRRQRDRDRSAPAHERAAEIVLGQVGIHRRGCLGSYVSAVTNSSALYST